MTEKTLLLIDGLINLALGFLLGIFPKKVISFLGIPLVEEPFYPSILGGILFGIGIALLLERSKEKFGQGGLGLSGAIAINCCGGLVLGLWLMFGELDVSLKGKILMWCLVAILFVVSAFELNTGLKEQKNRLKPDLE